MKLGSERRAPALTPEPQAFPLAPLRGLSSISDSTSPDRNLPSNPRPSPTSPQSSLSSSPASKPAAHLGNLISERNLYYVHFSPTPTTLVQATSPPAWRVATTSSLVSASNLGSLPFILHPTTRKSINQIKSFFCLKVCKDFSLLIIKAKHQPWPTKSCLPTSTSLYLAALNCLSPTMSDLPSPCDRQVQRTRRHLGPSGLVPAVVMATHSHMMRGGYRGRHSGRVPVKVGAPLGSPP